MPDESPHAARRRAFLGRYEPRCRRCGAHGRRAVVRFVSLPVERPRAIPSGGNEHVEHEVWWAGEYICAECRQTVLPF